LDNFALIHTNFFVYKSTFLKVVPVQSSDKMFQKHSAMSTLFLSLILVSD